MAQARTEDLFIDDLFISYAEADRAWVEGYLVDALEQAEVRCTYESAFTLGVPRILEFDRAIRQSRYTLLIVSEAYLADDLTRFIDILAQSYGEQVGTWPVIPLTRQEGLQLPPRLKMLSGLTASSSEQWEVAIARLCQQLKHPLPPPSPKPACPYPGMMPFSENDEGRFFGRDEEIEEMLGRLRLHPFLTAIGPSGSGKSSLIFAGLIPKLKQSGLFGSVQWCIRSFRPGTNPLASLQTALGGDITALEVRVQELLSTQADARRLLVVVDQFEELFTQAGAEAIPFQQALLKLLEIPNVYLILNVRADFYPDLMVSLLWEKISSHRFEVLPLDEKGLRQAIVRPAEGVNVYIDSALVERLLVDAKGEPGILPLIQETLVLLWEKLERCFLPLSAYKKTGLQSALSFRADAALADLKTEEKRAIARRIFLRLIQFGEGRPDTRRQQLEEALQSEGDDFVAFQQTLEHLATCRLLTFSGEKDSQHRKIDIAHEALITGWDLLQKWIIERREAEQTRRRLDTKVQEWVERGKGKGGLLDEVELAEAKRWLLSLDAKELGFPKNLCNLVEASQNAIEAAKQEKEAAHQRELEQAKALAEEQRQRAEEQRCLRLNVLATSLANQSSQIAQNQLDTDDLSALLSIQAYRLNQQSRGYALQVIDSALRLVLSLPHSGPILPHAYDCVFSPDSQKIAIYEIDGTVILYEIKFTHAICNLLTSNYKDRKNYEYIIRLPGYFNITPHDRSNRDYYWHGFFDANSLVFSSDGQFLVVVSEAMVTLWNLNQPKSPLLQFTTVGKLNHQSLQFDLEYMEVFVKGLSDNSPRNHLLIKTVAFSPDNEQLALSLTDNSIISLELQKIDAPLIIDLFSTFNNSLPFINSIYKSQSETESIISISFQNNNQLISYHWGGTIKIHDLALSNAAPLKVTLLDWQGGSSFRGGPFHDNPTNLSLDGQIVVECQNCVHPPDISSNIIYWELGEICNPQLRPLCPKDGAGVDGNIEAVAISNNKSILAASGRHYKEGTDRYIYLWRLSHPTTKRYLLKTDVQWHTLLISPNNQLLASGDYQKIQLWYLYRTNTTSVVLKEFSEKVHSITFSGDGKRLLAYALDNTISWWDFEQIDKAPVVLKLQDWGLGLIDPPPTGHYSPLDAASSWMWYEQRRREQVMPITCSLDGQKAALCVLTNRWQLKKILIWDLDKLNPHFISLQDISDDHIISSQVIKFSHDNESLLWIESDRNDTLSIKKLALQHNEEQSTVLQGLSGRFSPKFFNHNANLLWIVNTSYVGPSHSYDESSIRHCFTPSLYNLSQPNLEELRFQGIEGSYDITSTAIGEDATKIALGTNKGLIAIWHCDRPEAKPINLYGYQETAISSLAFSADGERLASAGEDWSIRLWDLTRPEVNPIILEGHEDKISSLLFSPDGRFLASGSDDGTVRLWIAKTEILVDLVRQKVQRDLTPDEWKQYIGEDIPYEPTQSQLEP